MASILYSFFCEDVRNEVNGTVTAVGLFGGQMRVAGTPPVRLRSLAFHAFVANPDHQAYPFHFSLTGPGIAQQLEVGGELPAQPGIYGHNLNWNFEGMIIPAAGSYQATLQIGSTPPVEKTTTLEVVFEPPPNP